jgi:hypothetical protein
MLQDPFISRNQINLILQFDLKKIIIAKFWALFFPIKILQIKFCILNSG